MKRKKILLLGKTPPPFMGPSIATKIILESELSNSFKLIHQQTKLNSDLQDIGKAGIAKMFKLIRQYLSCILKIIAYRPSLMIVPISQSKSGFYKDSVFIKIGALFGVKILVYLRGSNFLNFYNTLPYLDKAYGGKTLAKCNGAIVLGEKLRYIFDGFFTADKIHVVPNGADYNFNSISTDKLLGIEKPKLRVVYLGNLQPSKGILDVLEAFTLLTNKVGAELHVVGHWRDEDTMVRCKEIASAMPDKVFFHEVFTGQKKLNFLKKADIMVFTPKEPEGHPWVIVEGMAAGLPIISTNMGAISESVQDGLNGYIVNISTPGEIAFRLDYLLKNDKLRKKMASASRRLYEEQFTETRMIQRLESVICNTIC